MSQMTPWGAMVGEMLRRRMLLQHVAPDVYPMPPFGVRGTAADLAAAEARLGHALDAQHAAILREVNGWQGAFANGDILGTDDLGTGPRWQHAQAMLTIYYEDGPLDGWPPRESIYPIQLCETSLFVIDAAGPVTDEGHPVYWLSGEILGVWPNAYEYWLAGMSILDQTRAIVTGQAG